VGKAKAGLEVGAVLQLAELGMRRPAHCVFEPYGVWDLRNSDDKQIRLI